MLKTIFMGTPSLVENVLTLLHEKTDLVGIVTAPDARGKRGKKLLIPYPKQFAIENNVTFFQPETLKKNDELYNNLSELSADIIVVISYGYILPKRFINLPKLRSVNIHASLLPKYRGASPIQSALLNGDDVTGITIQEISRKLDCGDMILKKSVSIEQTDNYFSLLAKLCDLSASATREYLMLEENGSVHTIEQDDNEAEYCYKIKKEDGCIDWNEPAERIFNQIRAFAEWPKSFTSLEGKKMIIHRAELMEDYDKGKPGEIVKADKTGLYVSASDGVLSIKDLQLEKCKMLDYKSFLNGNKIKPGTVLTKPEPK